MSGFTAAIDAGTSLIKVVVLDEAGVERVTVSRPTQVVRTAGGHSEQDMDDVLEAVLAALGEAGSLSPAPIERIALTAQGDGYWPVDAHLAPAGAAVLWNDGRAAEVVAEWDAAGSLDAAFRINGSLGNSGLPHAIMTWLRRYEPARLEPVSTVLTCGSWLYASLTGIVGLHPSDASAPWLDIRTGVISDELLALCGLDWARSLIPMVLDETELTAALLPGVAARTGLPAGIPVTLAPYDVVATAWGSGALSPGSSFCILGTTLCVGVQLEKPDTTGTPAGLTLLNRTGSEQSVRAFPTLAGTGVIDWMMTLLGVPNPSALSELARTSRPGAGGVRMWPYLSSAGERAPFLDPDARGVLAGFTFDSTPGDLARATFEGLAHVIRDCLDATGARPDVLALSGGGAASHLWCQTIADVTGVTVASESGAQLGARGAFLAARRTASPVIASESVLAAIATDRIIFEPEPVAAAAAEDRHEDFLRSRDALAERWSTWDRKAE